METAFVKRTTGHQRWVRHNLLLLEGYLGLSQTELHERALQHDASKWHEPERVGYIWLNWQFFCKQQKRAADFPYAVQQLDDKNHFYRANRELGRILKTENILEYMSDPLLRKNRRRGLLKGEQIHQLARDVAYGKRGKISVRDLHEQKNTCSCLTLILACVIYWQAKEINRIVNECSDELDPACLAMLPHVSPIGWDNVILYGEYVVDKRLIR